MPAPGAVAPASSRQATSVRWGLRGGKEAAEAGRRRRGRAQPRRTIEQGARARSASALSLSLSPLLILSPVLAGHAGDEGDLGRFRAGGSDGGRHGGRRGRGRVGKGRGGEEASKRDGSSESEWAKLAGLALSQVSLAPKNSPAVRPAPAPSAGPHAVPTGTLCHTPSPPLSRRKDAMSAPLPARPLAPQLDVAGRPATWRLPGRHRAGYRGLAPHGHARARPGPRHRVGAGAGTPPVPPPPPPRPPRQPPRRP